MAKMKNRMTVQEFASMGGRARAKQLTKKRRSEIAKKAIRARWDGSGPRFTYFACSQDKATVKIGSTVNVSSRIRSLHCNPANRAYCGNAKVILLGVFRDRGAFSEESLQKKFSKHQIDPCHEWFKLSGEIVEFLRSHRRNMNPPVPDLDHILSK